MLVNIVRLLNLRIILSRLFLPQALRVYLIILVQTVSDRSRDAAYYVPHRYYSSSVDSLPGWSDLILPNT